MMNLTLEPFGFEWAIMDWFEKIKCTFSNYFFYGVSEGGTSVAILIIITIIYWCIDKNKGRKIAFICFTTIGINNFFKMLFSCKRPFQYEGKEYLRKLQGTSLSDGASGTSFPSGHSQNTAAIYGSLVRYFKKHKAVVIPSIIMIILVPISRLYLGVHFPSDVVVGLTLGLITVIGLGTLLDKYENKIWIIYLGTLVILFPILFFKGTGKDFYRGYGLLLGFVIGDIIDNKCIHFTNIKGVKVNILRYIIGIVIVGVSYLLFSKINHLPWLSDHTVLYRTSYVVTHMLLVMIATVLIPLIFTKCPILNGNKRKDDKHE